MRAGWRDLPSQVRVLVAVGFLVALGFGLVAPALPIFARQFGVGKTAAGAVVSAFAFSRLVMAPFVGRIVNAFGERRTLATGIGIVAVSSALAGLSQSYLQLLALRGVGGIGSIMFSVGAASLLVRVTPSHQRGQAQGVWAGSFLIGLVAGPAIGTIASISLRLPFFLYAATLTAAGTVAMVALRRSEYAEADLVRPAPMALSAALAQRAYLAALAVTFAGSFAVVGARSSLMPQFVVDRLGLGTSWVYGPFLVVTVISGALLLPAGRVADTIGRRPVMMIGLSMGAVGFMLLPGVPTEAGLLLSAALIGVASAADSVGPGAVMGDVVAGRGGTVVAVFQMAGDLGAVLGPILCGLVADGFGYDPALLMAAAVCLLPIGLVAAAPETLHARPRMEA